MDHDHHHETYVVGDRIRYMNTDGTVKRINILGMRPCCAIQVNWDDNTKLPSILQMNELKHVTKL